MANVNFFSPDGGTTRYPIEDTEARSRIAGQQSLIKDTVGWTGKNLIPLPYEFGTSQTQGGITAKVNTDGSITFNGTVTSSVSFRLKGRSVNDNNYFLVKPGRYIFSCNNIENNFYWGIATTKNNSYVAILDGIHESTIELTITSDMSDEAVDGAIPLALYANFRTLGDVYNDFTIYPMLRRADITDPTYEPYHESVEEVVEQIYADNGVLGAKNLLKVVATSQTINGVTFTVNADGSVTVNGTATDIINFIVSDVMPFSSNSPYILNGCPAGGNYATYRLDLRNSEGHADNDLVDYGDGCLCNKSGDYYVNIRIASGATVSNLTFYPMLRLASDPDDTYVPYAMTNKELTEKKAGLYTKGDTVQCGLSLVGHVTTGTTKLELTLRGNFDKANISNVSVGTSRLLIRGINGYLKTDNDVELNNILFSDYLKLDNFYIFPQHIDLRISLINGGEFTNVDNNTLIDIQNMTLILS